MNIEVLTVTPRPFFDTPLIYPTHKPRSPWLGLQHAAVINDQLIGSKKRYEQILTFASMARIRNFRGAKFYEFFALHRQFFVLRERFSDRIAPAQPSGATMTPEMLRFSFPVCGTCVEQGPGA